MKYQIGIVVLEVVVISAFLAVCIAPWVNLAVQAVYQP